MGRAEVSNDQYVEQPVESDSLCVLRPDWNSRDNTVANRLAARTTLSARISQSGAAGGASNPGIAGQLFVSRKTVEYHLHKAFTKLGIAGRLELVKLDLS